RPDGRHLAPAHLAAEQRRMRRTGIAAVTEAEAAGALEPVGIFGLLAVTCRDHEAVFIIGDGEIAVHVFDLRNRKTGLVQNRLPAVFAELALAEIDAHREH